VKRQEELKNDILIGANNPLALDDPDRLWLVTEGRVDVFSVRMVNGIPAGHREHLLTARVGDVLWGVGVEKESGDTGFIAAGLYGTRLTELNRAQFLPDREQDRETNGAQLIDLVCNWVDNAIEGIACTILPKNYRELEESGRFELTGGEQALCRDGVLWVRPLTGRTVFKGRDDSYPLLEERYFPVTGRGCIQALDNSVLKVRSCNDLFADEDPFAVVERFNATILSIVVARRAHLERVESRRAGERAERDERILRLSMQQLAEVMRSREPGRESPFPAEHPLLAACQAVGRAGRIEVRAPKSPPVNLASIARASGIRVRQVILKGEWWKFDSGPLLGFLEDGDRPVALLPRSKTRYQLVNETDGTSVPVDTRTANSIKPFAWSFYRPFPPRPIGAFDLWRFGFQSVWKSDIAAVILIGLLGGLLGLVTPVATGLIFNTIIPQAERLQLLHVGLILLVSVASGLMFQIAKAAAMLRIESRMNVSLQAAVMDRLLSLPVPFFRKYTSGDLANRASGINTIRQVLSGTTIESIFSGTFSLLNLFLLFYYSSYLAIRAILLTMVSVSITILAGWLTTRYQREITEISGRLNGLVLQIIGGMAKFRVSGSEKRVFHLWAREFGLNRRLQFRKESVSNHFAAWNALYPVVASMLLFYLVVSGSGTPLSVGSFLAFNAAFTNFSIAMLSLSGAFISVMAVVPLYQRTKPILRTPPEVNESKADPGELRGEIEISHVRFRYDPDAPVILDDLYLNIRPGQFIALVGFSGSGKSSLLRLMLGFEIPESGAVYYDGQDLSTLDLRAVRSQIGVVLQNGRVTAGDIYSNIIGASTELAVQDAWAAAELAGLAKDIRAMPMGMYTYVSEGGTTLSGGQRQRLLIARAIVSKPRIVFFDEATSALDNRTQEIVSEGLQRLNATRVVIAHRLSTVIGADRIVVLSRGRIVQEGRYRQLIEEEGLFADLARRQLE
jgi:NHLM bacteriocin system ABC transporter ATP-binding protein